MPSGGQSTATRDAGVLLATAFFTDTSPTLASRYLDELPRILAFYESRLGPYPYPKLNVAQVSFFSGGLGSAGLIAIGPPGFAGDSLHRPAAFLAHECAHAWFGNLLGLDLSPGSIPWLSEAFAEYWDAMYRESRDGHAAFVQLMRGRAETYYRALALARLEDKALDDVKFRDPIYAPLTYEKGSFVLHALRAELGDDAFFKAMREYVDEHRNSVVHLADFQRAAEKQYGKPLDWFFDQWVTRPGIPRLRIARAYQESAPAKGAAGKYRTLVTIEQDAGTTGKAAPEKPFRLPVDLDLELKSGAKERRRVRLEGTSETLSIETAEEPVKVTLDPDYWILKHPKSEDWEKTVTADAPADKPKAKH